jgi:hypothetical protein
MATLVSYFYFYWDLHYSMTLLMDTDFNWVELELIFLIFFLCKRKLKRTEKKNRQTTT